MGTIRLAVCNLLLFVLPLRGMGTLLCKNVDLLIENARIIDGSGSAMFRGYVAISGDQITRVGETLTQKCRQEAKNVFDAGGAYLCPGFIDSHTHDDIAVLTTPTHPAKLLQGVTTIITGNCGFSNYPNGDNALIQEHLATLLGDTDPKHFFKNFTGYAEFLSDNGIGLNIGSLVGHGPLRLAVVGSHDRPAMANEILQMVAILEEQLSQGALGLSFGLVYPPSAYAHLEELIALARAVKKYGRALSAHIKSYEGSLLESIDLFLKILRESGAKGLLSHLQVAGIPYWGTIMPLAIKKIEEAIASGVDIQVDMYPYLAGSSTILQILPPSAMADGFEAFVERLQSDPEYYEILKNLTETGSEPGWESKIALIGWENVVINSVVNSELFVIQGLSIPDGAKKLNYTTEFEFFIHVVVTDKGMSNVIMFQQSEADQASVFKLPYQMVGSDSIPRAEGKPHPRMYGTFPRVMNYFALDPHTSIMSIEEAVRKSTSMAAQRFGLTDRGLIQARMAADLVIFTENIKDTATYDNPESSPTDIVAVWVNGVQVVENGTTTSELPGVVFSL